MPAGRPFKFKTPKELQTRIDAYFDEMTYPAALTLNGLAWYLDVETDTLRNYEQRDNYSVIIKRARQRIAAYWEARLASNAPTGAIFWLKNDGWKDRQEVEDKKTFEVTGLEKLNDEELDAFVKGLQARVGKGPAGEAA